MKNPFRNYHIISPCVKNKDILNLKKIYSLWGFISPKNREIKIL